MYSSPVTPGGTSLSASSSTYTRVPATGEPIGGAPLPASRVLIVAHTVVSVGPYALNIRRPRDHSATSSPGHASPATISKVSWSRDPGGSEPSTAGGSVTCVTPVRARYAASSAPIRCPDGTVTSAAPASSAMQHSTANASKLGEANCATRESAPMPNAAISNRDRLAIPVWATTTPLGVPVEPEV